MRRALAILFALGTLGALAVALAERHFAAAPRRADVRQNAAVSEPAPIEEVRQNAAAAPVRPPPTVSAAPPTVSAATAEPETTPRAETGLSGVLLDSRCAPLPRCKLIFIMRQDWKSNLYIVRTDENGGFRLRAPPGVYHVSASTEDEALPSDLVIPLDEGERLDGLELELVPRPRPPEEDARVDVETSEGIYDQPSDEGQLVGERPPPERRVIVIDPIVVDDDSPEPARPEPPDARVTPALIY